MKPIMLMRKAGLSGVEFRKHFKSKRLSKSVGQFYDINGAGGKLKALAGYTGSISCAGGYQVPYSVKFSKQVFFTDHTGCGFYNATQDIYATNVTAPLTQGVTVIQYDLTWSSPPVYGDVIGFIYDGGDYADLPPGYEDRVLMESQELELYNCTQVPLELIDITVTENTTPGTGGLVLRSQYIDVRYNQPVTATTNFGMTAIVNGEQQAVTLASVGLIRLKLKLERAMFLHEVTYQYNSALGDVEAVTGGEPAGDIPQTIAINNLPTYTVWDYNGSATGAYNETLWDADDTRFDNG